MSPVLPPVSWARMSGAVAKVRARLERAAAALDRAGVAYAVIGGNAVAAWVSRVDEAAVRNTRDVDLLLRREDLPAATACLDAVGLGVFRYDAPGCEAVRIVVDDSPESKAWVDEIEIEDGFRFIALETLVRMKLAAFRDKDRVHLRDLISVGLVDAEWLNRLPPKLAERLRQVLADPEG